MWWTSARPWSETVPQQLPMVSATLGGGYAQNDIAGGVHGHLSHATYTWQGLTLVLLPAQHEHLLRYELGGFSDETPQHGSG